MYNKSHCEPKEFSDKGDISCLSNRLLITIAEILNENNKANINIKGGLKELHLGISNEIKKNTKCSNEACWTTYDLIKNNLSTKDFNELISNFRPFLPEEWYKEPNKWLNTLDIDNVMKQYQEAIQEDVDYQAMLETVDDPNDPCSQSNMGTYSLNVTEQDTGCPDEDYDIDI